MEDERKNLDEQPISNDDVVGKAGDAGEDEEFEDIDETEEDEDEEEGAVDEPSAR